MVALNIYTVSTAESDISSVRQTIYLITYPFLISLIGIQEKLGILHNGEVYAVFSYDAQNSDELTFQVNDRLIILRKGDDAESEWWWAKNVNDEEGYVPRNLLGVSRTYHKTKQHKKNKIKNSSSAFYGLNWFSYASSYYISFIRC